MQGEGRGCIKCVLLSKEGGRGELGHWIEPSCMQLIVVRYAYATVYTSQGYLHTWLVSYQQDLLLLVLCDWVCWQVLLSRFSPPLLATPTIQDMHTLPEEEGRSQLAMPLVESEICETTCS